MADVSEKTPVGRLQGSPSASSSERRDEAGQAPPGTISTRDLIEPIFMRTFYVGVFAPLLFAYLGSSNVLAPFGEQSRWLVSRLSPIWPALSAQYELVLEVRGPGHASSYGLMCAALWTWPVICSIAFFRGHVKCRKEILPISPKEIGQFIVAFPFVFLLLALDQTRITSPLFGFHADQYDLFYLRQWFLFSLTALVLAVVLYVVGRIILKRTWRRVPTTKIAAFVAAISIALAGVAVADPQEGALQPGQTFRDCSDCPDMVVIPAGSFLMGSSAEETARDLDAVEPRDEFKFAQASTAFEHLELSVSINRPFASGKYAFASVEMK